MPAVKLLLHINAPQEKVYEAISSLNGIRNWWTVDTTGNDKPGGVLQFRFGNQGPDFKVLELKPFTMVTWECVSGPEDWMGTQLIFKLDQNEGKTRVRFEHAKWKEDSDFFASCAFSWSRYLESLRQYCQTGKGEAFGSPGYRK